MQTQLEQLVNVLPLLGALSILVYLTGRWYVEWYFNQFSTNYQSLLFDKIYYLHASWNTISSGFCFLAILINIGLTFYFLPAWYWSVATTIVVLISVAIFMIWPFKFNPQSPFFKKLLGAKEFSLQTMGFLSVIISYYMVLQYTQKFKILLSTFSRILQSNFYVNALFLFVVAWIYLRLVGYILGVYHGQSAISYGRMGVKFAKVGNVWWILVARSTDGRNLVYDKNRNMSKFVSDEEIAQIKNFVLKK